MPETNVHTLKSFLIGPLPQIIADAKKLKAILINPGREETNPSGEVPSGEDNLKIFLVTEMIPTLILKKVAATGRTEDSERLFIAIYLPDRQFEEFRALVLRLRGSYPTATIAVLACNHAPAIKEDALVPLLRAEVTDFLVLDNTICGGERVICEIICHLEKLWP
ncbi:MAG: hypothetical protein WC268_04310 [Patescibacteria group bacterium]|jgi:hypothetical protein